MEADTKKRGRPAIFDAATYNMLYDHAETKRGIQNKHYAAIIIVQVLNQNRGDFFVTAKGEFRKQGIAEQIGRLYYHGILTEEQARELSETCMEDYKAGASVKEIEKKIRQFGEMMK